MPSFTDREGHIRLGYIAVAVVLIAMLFVAVAYVGTYNNFVSLSQNVDKALGDIGVQLQRRYDLIPRVVNATKLYLQHERQLLEEITRLRSQWAEAKNKGDVQGQLNASAALDSKMTTFLADVRVIVEQYPELKADLVVRDLITELEGTENRIGVARTRYNEAVLTYNTAISMIPGSLVAQISGFKQRPYYKSVPGSETAPLVPLYSLPFLSGIVESTRS